MAKILSKLLITITLCFMMITDIAGNSEIVREYTPDKKINNEILLIATNYIMRHNSKITLKSAENISKIAYNQSEKGNLPFSLIIAQIKQESHFRTTAVSYLGAKGLPQIMHSKWTWYEPYNNIIKNSNELFIPSKSIRAQVLILNTFISWENGNTEKALNRYSGFAKKYAYSVLKSKYYLDKQFNKYIRN